MTMSRLCFTPSERKECFGEVIKELKNRWHEEG